MLQEGDDEEESPPEAPDQENDRILQPLLRQEVADRNQEVADRDPEVAEGDQEVVDGDQEVDESICSGSVRSSCSEGTCPICRERRDSNTVLHCDHTLCQQCVSAIMRRAAEPGRLRCPFCRQTTPLPQWEIRRLQEESYGGFLYQADLQVPPVPLVLQVPQVPVARGVSALPCVRDRCSSWPRPLCITIAVLLLVSMVILGCSLYSALISDS